MLLKQRNKSLKGLIRKLYQSIFLELNEFSEIRIQIFFLYGFEVALIINERSDKKRIDLRDINFPFHTL